MISVKDTVKRFETQNHESANRPRPLKSSTQAPQYHSSFVNGARDSAKEIIALPAAADTKTSIVLGKSGIQPVSTFDHSELWPNRSKLQEIIPGICITNYFGSRNLKALNDGNITHVVVCADELAEMFPAKFSYLKLAGLSDNTTTSLSDHLKQALPWIDRAVSHDGRVLVHCAAGSSRSDAVLVAYLMWSQHMTLEESLALARKGRPIIHPNPGFIAQLQKFEQAKCDLESLSS